MRSEREGGIGSEKEFSAILRFCRWVREPISGERIPVRFKPEMSREMTEEEEEEEEQVMNGQLQWWVVVFHEERDFCGS